MANENLQKQAMLELFKQKASPTQFLSSFFRRDPRWVVNTRKIIIDIVRNKEKIAVDVTRGTGGRVNAKKSFSTNPYTPPVYDEYTTLEAEELLERVPGRTEYDDAYGLPNAAQVLAVLTDDQIELQDKILRAIEKQAADTLLTGKVILANGDEIDFKQKASHNFDAGVSWGLGAADPIADLTLAANLNRKDGKVTSTVAIFGSGAWEQFLTANTQNNRFDLRNAELANITMPMPLGQQNGAMFHGTVAAGSYRLQCWTYPQYYEVPSAAELGGIALPNAGTIVPYIPNDKIIVIPMPNAIDLRLVFAGIPQLVPQRSPELAGIGLTMMPMSQPGAFHPYAYTDQERKVIKNGVASAPLTVPTQIDGWSVVGVG